MKAYIWFRIASEAKNGNGLLELDLTKRKLYWTFYASWQKIMCVKAWGSVCEYMYIYSSSSLGKMMLKNTKNINILKDQTKITLNENNTKVEGWQVKRNKAI